MKIVALLLFLVACATMLQGHNPLVDEDLRPMAGHAGKLTNSACAVGGKDCVFDLLEYDLSDPAVRATLTKLDFRCVIAGEDFYVCPDTAALCTRDNDIVTGVWPFRKHTVVIRSIDAIKDYQLLIDADTLCRAHKGT